MPCEHIGPLDIMQMAEDELRSRGMAAAAWPGVRFRHSENTPGTMWASVVIEIERRGDQWIVTRLDRNKEPVADDDAGLRML